MEIHIDAVTFQGAWNRKFTWTGELVNSFQVMSHTRARVGPGRLMQAGQPPKVNLGARWSCPDFVDNSVKLPAQPFA